MGLVYRATHLRLKRSVALKVIAPELSDDPRVSARFERESEIAASLRHPNIVTIFDAGEAADRLYITMEYVEGSDLGTVIALEGGVELGRAAGILSQVASALDAAHSLGLVHRDVKPANVLLADDSGRDHAYLTDFGLAKYADAGSGLTSSGAVVGTPDYMAPEQIIGDRLDARTDVYALGCLLYHALTGEVPYPRASIASTMWAHMNDPPPRATELRGDLPAGIDAVLQRAMAKEAAQRFPSAGDLARAVFGAVGGTVVVAPERTVATGDAAPPSAEPPRTARHRLLRQPTLVGDAIPVGSKPKALAVGAGGIWVAHSEGLLSCIDAELGKVVGDPIRISHDWEYVSLTADDASVWVADYGYLFRFDPHAGELLRFDHESGRLTAEEVLGIGPSAVTFGGGDVWLADTDRARLSRIEPQSGRLTGGPFKIPASPSRLAVGARGVWAVHAMALGAVSCIDPRSGRRDVYIQDTPHPIDLATTARDIWITDPYEQAVVRVNEQSGRVAGEPIKLDGRPLEIAAGMEGVWVTDQFSGAVWHIDPHSGLVVGECAEIEPRLSGIAVGAGFVWVGHLDDGTVLRIRP
jgi:streptogramin lyase